MDKDKKARILDLGCGTGAFLSRLKTANHKHLVGVDIKAPVQEIPGVLFEEYDLDSGALPFEDGSFDLIISIEVIEHIENLGTLLKEMARVLSPSGTVLITTPNVHSLEARIRYLFQGKLKQFDELSDPTHVSPIFLFPFRRLLKRYGLEISKLGRYPMDGSSPTTAAPLRALAILARLLGLRGLPAGDHLSLAIRHIDPVDRAPAISKQTMVTGHY